MRSWKQLPYFLAVARSGSFRAGAAELGATHATTRRQIDELEMVLGTRLLHRDRSGVELTEAGRRFLSEALEAERHVMAAENRVLGLDREASGTVRLSCEALIARSLLPPVLAQFSQRYPEIDIDLKVGDSFDDVAGHEVDLAVRIAADPPAGARADRICPFNVATYASQTYLAEQLPLAGPRGEGLAWIGYDDAGVAGRIAASPFPDAPLRYKTTDLDTHLALVRAGAGLSVLPTWVESRYPELQQLPGTRQETGRAIWLVINTDLARITRVRRFAKVLSTAIAASSGADRSR
jgi:DNA-binding transcriptional LysR family regulator